MKNIEFTAILKFKDFMRFILSVHNHGNKRIIVLLLFFIIFICIASLAVLLFTGNITSNSNKNIIFAMCFLIFFIPILFFSGIEAYSILIH